jgi:hypothetical protein
MALIQSKTPALGAAAWKVTMLTALLVTAGAGILGGVYTWEDGRIDKRLRQAEQEIADLRAELQAQGRGELLEQMRRNAAETEAYCKKAQAAVGQAAQHERNAGHSADRSKAAADRAEGAADRAEGAKSAAGAAAGRAEDAAEKAKAHAATAETGAAAASKSANVVKSILGPSPRPESSYPSNH